MACGVLIAAAYLLWTATAASSSLSSLAALLEHEGARWATTEPGLCTVVQRIVSQTCGGDCAACRALNKNVRCDFGQSKLDNATTQICNGVEAILKRPKCVTKLCKQCEALERAHSKGCPQTAPKGKGGSKAERALLVWPSAETALMQLIPSARKTVTAVAGKSGAVKKFKEGIGSDAQLSWTDNPQCLDGITGVSTVFMANPQTAAPGASEGPGKTSHQKIVHEVIQKDNMAVVNLYTLAAGRIFKVETNTGKMSNVVDLCAAGFFQDQRSKKQRAAPCCGINWAQYCSREGPFASSKTGCRCMDNSIFMGQIDGFGPQSKADRLRINKSSPNGEQYGHKYDDFVVTAGVAASQGKVRLFMLQSVMEDCGGTIKFDHWPKWAPENCWKRQESWPSSRVFGVHEQCTVGKPACTAECSNCCVKVEQLARTGKECHCANTRPFKKISSFLDVDGHTGEIRLWQPMLENGKPAFHNIATTPFYEREVHLPNYNTKTHQAARANFNKKFGDHHGYRWYFSHNGPMAMDAVSYKAAYGTVKTQVYVALVNNTNAYHPYKGSAKKMTAKGGNLHNHHLYDTTQVFVADLPTTPTCKCVKNSCPVKCPLVFKKLKGIIKHGVMAMELFPRNSAPTHLYMAKFSTHGAVQMITIATLAQSQTSSLWLN